MEMLGHYRWRVYEPFRFYISVKTKNDVIEVPVGFITDHTVPRIFYCCHRMENMPKQQQSFTTTCTTVHYATKESDLIFLDGMTVLGVCQNGNEH